MIPYEELDRALQKWKARSQNAADAAREFEAAGAVPGVDGLPPPSAHTGEIDIGDAESVVESYEEAE